MDSLAPFISHACTFLATWTVRISLLIGFLTISPWLLWVLYDFLLYIFRFVYAAVWSASPPARSVPAPAAGRGGVAPPPTPAGDESVGPPRTGVAVQDLASVAALKKEM